MKNFRLEFDRDYGIDKRTGWSIVVNGCFVVQLEPWLIVAIWKGCRNWRRPAGKW